MKIWLDDLRDPNDRVQGVLAQKWIKDRDDHDDWVWAKTAHEVIALLETEEVTEMSLDHDLGDDDKFGTGYDVVVWIEDAVFTRRDYVPPIVHIHTANYIGKRRMEAGLLSIRQIVAGRG